jgi:chromosome segregation ATPase
MDFSEDELTRLRDDNQVLRKQLELLRVNNELQFVPDDTEYDESVAPDSSSATEHFGEANAVPDSTMKRTGSEVETATADRAKLESELRDLKAAMDRSKRLAKYEKDDMTRVNRSLRDDLETVTRDKLAIEDELEVKCEEFDTLNEDVERFAETFAAQHEKLQKLESQSKKLQRENQRLVALDEDKTKRIGELETLLETKSAQWVGTEIGKLWDEIGRLRSTEADSPRSDTEGES